MLRPSAALLALLAACSSSPSTPTPDAAAADAPAADVPGADTATPDAMASDAPADATASDAPATDTPGGSGGVDTFLADSAAAVCGALFRCCGGGDAITRYFAYYTTPSDPARASDPAAYNATPAVRMRLPPRDEASCRQVLTEALATPFGDWVREAREGRVGFDAAAAGRCRATLASATCGRAVWEALQDSTCFGLQPPAGGPVQRRMFTRTRAEGMPCRVIRDGTGARLYGSCDPSRAFCCHRNPAFPMSTCAVAPSSMLETAEGTCRAVSAMGAACGIAPNLQLCATGASCGGGGTCTAVSGTAAIAVGQPCQTADGALLGDCTNGFCDYDGTRRCIALRADAASCAYGYQCASGNCECPAGGCFDARTMMEAGACRPWTLCMR